MQSQAVNANTKKSVSFVGLDDKKVDLVAARGQYIRSIYKLRRRQQKAWKQSQHQAWKQSQKEEREQQMDRFPKCTAFLCHVYALQQQQGGATDVVQILALDIVAYTRQQAEKLGLMVAPAPIGDLPSSLLQWPCTWGNADDLLGAVHLWSETCTRDGLYKPVDRTTTVVSSLKVVLGFLSDVDNACILEFLRQGQHHQDADESTEYLKRAVAAIKVGVENITTPTFHPEFFVAFYLSQDWLDRTGGMSHNELAEVLLGGGAILPFLNGHISSSSAGSVNSGTSSDYVNSGTAAGSVNLEASVGSDRSERSAAPHQWDQAQELFTSRSKMLGNRA
jgi:hypothetical protein